MEVGFDTIGNATVICYDRGPVLATDPWVQGGAYFGSWTLSHEIPAEQLEAIRGVPYVWFSHGHPDHLNGDSLPLFKDKQVLIPDHIGGRIHKDLTEQGFNVRVLPERTWVELSPRVRVMCLPDYNQDAVLLIDVNGRLVVNLNDASDRGWGAFVKNVIRQYKISFLLALSGYGDADMINFYGEDGRKLPHYGDARTPIGQTVARQAELFGVKYFVPFSSMHKYQRIDSAWASKYTTKLSEYANGFSSKTVEITPAFIRYDCEKDVLTPINPKERMIALKEPTEFGDDWNERLEKDDVKKLDMYFKQVERLGNVLDFINFRVGAQDNVITFNDRKFKKGLTFEAPRGSLMTSVQYEIFDDLLISNFIKCTLHGEWGPLKLYPDFTPYVAKYGDNGRARTKEELDRYFASYRQRDQLGWLRHKFETGCVRPAQEAVADFLRNRVGQHSPLFRAAKGAYWGVRRLI
jgi:L-ascorbate metabolism protein UlaG (beta-lactamase superfamily)